MLIHGQIKPQFQNCRSRNILHLNLVYFTVVKLSSLSEISIRPIANIATIEAVGPMYTRAIAYKFGVVRIEQ